MSVSEDQERSKSAVRLFAKEDVTADTVSEQVTMTYIGGGKRAMDVNVAGVTNVNASLRDFADGWSVAAAVSVTDAAALEIVPIANQIVVRLAPLDAGNYRYNFDNTVDETNSEAITPNKPITIQTNQSIFLRRDAGLPAGDVVVYQGSRTP